MDFIEALKKGNIETIRKFPKADLHNRKKLNSWLSKKMATFLCFAYHKNISKKEESIIDFNMDTRN